MCDILYVVLVLVSVHISAYTEMQVHTYMETLGPHVVFSLDFTFMFLRQGLFLNMKFIN